MRLRFFLTALLMVAAPANLLADGGMVLMHEQAPPYVITVFASPTPLRAGMIDLSVLVQSGETLDPVLDADVTFDLTKGLSKIHLLATRTQAQNKLLYAASTHLHDSGDWHLTATVSGMPKSASVSGLLTLGAGQPGLAPYRGYIALPFFCLAIFLLNQWLAARLRLRVARYR
jgi:hypothetical protein